MLNLEIDKIEIWPVDLRDFHSCEAKFFSLLDDTEKKRASSFKFEHLRYNYITSHGVQRLLIAQYYPIS